MLEDYWLGIRLEKMDIPAIHLVKSDELDLYLRLKGKDKDKTFF